MKRILAVLAVVVAGVLPNSLNAQQSSQHEYAEGPVIFHSYIRTKPGMFEQYLHYLATDWKRLMEAEKAAGLVVGYRVIRSSPRSENDYDLILETEYKNMAAFDGLSDREDPLLAKIFGSVPQSDQKMVDRGVMRVPEGERIHRVLVLK